MKKKTKLKGVKHRGIGENDKRYKQEIKRGNRKKNDKRKKKVAPVGPKSDGHNYKPVSGFKKLQTILNRIL